MSKKAKKRILVVDKDRILDEAGCQVPIDEALRRWEAGEVDDWNLAFARLANYHNFDLEALKSYYASRPA